MAARFFTKSGAVELVVHIMSLCETPSDLKALAATCVRTRDVWLANKATIMWQVWPQSDLALIAVSTFSQFLYITPGIPADRNY